MKSGNYDHIRLNLANGDMVGHTGDKEATISALETVDQCVGQLIKAAQEQQYFIGHGRSWQCGRGLSVGQKEKGL